MHMTELPIVYVEAADLKAWVTRVFMRVSVPDDDAAIAADVLVSASLRGVDTHGVLHWADFYIRPLRSGDTNPRRDIRAERLGPGTVLVDGDNGLGMVVAARAMREAIQLAREAGVAVAGVRRSNHFGAAAYYAQMASAAGMIGLAFTNTSPAIAPWGSLTPYLGTNPLAFAAPGGIEGGIVLDMATSQVAWGKVDLAARMGQKIPLGWATDREGRPTEDPVEALSGLMQPLGGYKGYGLALMVEILCAALTGAAFGPHLVDPASQSEQNVGHFFAAIDVERFMPLEQFKARMKQLVDEIHACPPAEGVERIYVPGEIELETALRRQREGIPLTAEQVAELAQMGEELSVPRLITRISG